MRLRCKTHTESGWRCEREAAELGYCRQHFNMMQVGLRGPVNWKLHTENAPEWVEVSPFVRRQRKTIDEANQREAVGTHADTTNRRSA